MTENTWPGKPGVPMNPEKEGPHWLRYEHDGYVEVSAFLWERDGYWVKSRHVHYSEWPGRWTYLGPVLTPDEVQNLREADAVKRRDAEQKLLHRDNLIEELVAMGSRNRAERDALQARVAELDGALGSARTILVKAFNRVHVLPRTSDTELADKIEATLGAIRAALTGGKDGV